MRHNYCVACGNKENLHQHHLVPKSAGGSNAANNLITLCGECHGRVHGHSVNYFNLIKKGVAKAKQQGVKFGQPAKLSPE